MSSFIDSLLARRARKQHTVRSVRNQGTLKSAREPEIKERNLVDHIPQKLVNEEKNRKMDVMGSGQQDLLAQIDEFREKAQELQEILNHKETRAKELQNLVYEREVRARELQREVTERKAQADGVARIIEEKFDGLMKEVGGKLDEVHASVSDMKSSVTDMKAAVSESIQESGKTQEERLEKMSEELRGQIQEDLGAMKGELAEKIHNESVQSYRNMSELVKNVEQKLDKMEALDKKLKSLKGWSVAIVLFTILNLAAVVCSILVDFGIINLGFLLG